MPSPRQHTLAVAVLVLLATLSTPAPAATAAAEDELLAVSPDELPKIAIDESEVAARCAVECIESGGG
jgi:hypothetical protein